MVRPTDQEMIGIEKLVCYSQFPRGVLYHDMQGHMGNISRVCQETEGIRGKHV